MKLRHCSMKVGLRYMDDLNPCSLCITNTSRKGNLLSFSNVNCIDGRIEFTWSSNVWTSSWWGQRMNVPSTYLSHIDDFNDAISSKYSMNMIVNTGDNSETHSQSFILSVYIRSHPKVCCFHTESQHFY